LILTQKRKKDVRIAVVGKSSTISLVARCLFVLKISHPDYFAFLNIKIFFIPSRNNNEGLETYIRINDVLSNAAFMGIEAVFSLVPSFNLNSTSPNVDPTIPFNQENQYMYTRGLPPTPALTARNILQNFMRWSKYPLKVRNYLLTFEFNYQSNDHGTISFCDSIVLGYDAYVEAFRMSTPDIDPKITNEELQTLKEFRFSLLSLSLRYKYVTLSGSLSGFRTDSRTCKNVRVLNFPCYDFNSNANPTDIELELNIEPDERKKELSRNFYVGFLELECVEKTQGFNMLVDGVLYRDVKKITISIPPEGSTDSIDLMTGLPIQNQIHHV